MIVWSSIYVSLTEIVLALGLLTVKTMERSNIQFRCPYVSYSDMVHHFIDDIYDFIDHNKDMELNRYGDILNQNGLKWGSKSMSTADVSNLDAQCIMALITGAVRAERFCDGALLGFFKDGSIRKWLERLKELDNGSGTEVR